MAAPSPAARPARSAPIRRCARPISVSLTPLPRLTQGCPGKIHYDAGACPVTACWTGYFLVVETQKGPGMRYSDSILGNLLKPISRRWFDVLVDRHDGNAYDKEFESWDHVVALQHLKIRTFLGRNSNAIR